MFYGPSFRLRSSAGAPEGDFHDPAVERYRELSAVTREDETEAQEARSADGRSVAHSDGEGLVYLSRRGAGNGAILVDLRNGKGRTGILRSLAWSGNGRYCALGYATGRGCSVVLVDMEKGTASRRSFWGLPIAFLPASTGALLSYSIDYNDGDGYMRDIRLFSPEGLAYGNFHPASSLSQAAFLGGGKRLAARSVVQGIAEVMVFDLERGLEAIATPEAAELAEQAAFPRATAFQGTWEAPEAAIRFEAEKLAAIGDGASAFPVKAPPEGAPGPGNGGYTGLVHSSGRFSSMAVFRSGAGSLIAMRGEWLGSERLALARLGPKGELVSNAVAGFEDSGGYRPSLVPIANANGTEALFQLSTDRQESYYLSRIGAQASKDGDWMLKYACSTPDNHPLAWLFPTSDGGCMAILCDGIESPMLFLTRFSRTGELLWSRYADWPERSRDNPSCFSCPAIGLDRDEVVVLLYYIDDKELAGIFADKERRASGLVFARFASDGSGVKAARLGKKAIPLEDRAFAWQNGAFLGASGAIRLEAGKFRMISLATEKLAGPGGMIPYINENCLLARAKKYESDDRGRFSGFAAWSSDLSKLWVIPYGGDGERISLPPALDFCVDGSGYAIFALLSEPGYGGLPDGSIILHRTAWGQGAGLSASPAAVAFGDLVDSAPLRMAISGGGVTDREMVEGFAVKRDVPELRQAEYRVPDAVGEAK